MRGQRLFRRAASLAIVVAATAGGIAAADVLVVPETEERAAPDPTPVPGTESTEARRADARGGAPWAIRVYRIANGDLCSDFGREVRGQLGWVNGRGDFKERRPEDAGGNCGNPSAGIGALVSATYYPDDPTTEEFEAPRTIVHGIAGPHVKTVKVAWPGGAETLEPSGRGGFISVADGGVGLVPVTISYGDRADETLELRLHIE